MEYYQIQFDPKDPNARQWERLNFILKRILTIISNIDGSLGQVDIKNTLTMEGNKILNGPPSQKKAEGAEFITRDYLRSSEAGQLISSLLAAIGKAPLTVQGSTGAPSGGGGGGGMANPMTDLGDLIYGNVSGVPTRLPGNITATQKFLAMTGTGAVAAAPSWQTVDLSSRVPYSGAVGDVDLGAFKLAFAAMSKALNLKEVPTTFNGLTASDWALGNIFFGTATASFTISNPTNPTADQRVEYRIKQAGAGGYTISFGAKFRFSADIPASAIVLSTTVDVVDRLGVIYDAGDDKFDVVAFVKGFA